MRCTDHGSRAWPDTDASAAHTAIKDMPNAEKLLGDQKAMSAAASTVMATSKRIASDISNFEIWG